MGDQRKKYTIDGEPVTARELIRAAAHIDDAFAADWLKCTSEAARILRENGQEVGHAQEPPHDR